MALIEGVVATSVLSFPIGWKVAYLHKSWMKVSLLIFTPIILAYVIYWLAAFWVAENNDAEYGAWSGALVLFWCAPSYLAIAFGYTAGRSSVRRKHVAANM